MHRGFGRADRQRVHHLDRGRNDAGADDRRTPPRRRRRSCRTRRAASAPSRAAAGSARSTLVTTASVPSEPTSRPSRSGPGVSASAPPSVHELAVGQHRFDAEHVMHGEAVLQAVRAAGVLGDVAADRADLLARRIGRVVVAERRDLPGDLEVGDARLDRHALVRDVDVEHAVQPRQRDDEAARDRQRAAGQAGAVAARDERHARARAQPHDRLHLAPPTTAARRPPASRAGGAARRTRRSAARARPRARPRRRQSAAVPPETRDPCVHLRGRRPQRSAVSEVTSEIPRRQYNPRIPVARRSHGMRRVSRRQFLEGTGTALTVAAVAPALRAQPCRSARRRAHDHHADRQRREAHAPGRRSLDAGRGAARSSRADRHQDRLRPRRVRRLHGAARRQAGLLVQPARGLGRRPSRSRRSKDWPERRLIRCSRRSSSTTRRSAASARRVS